MIFCLTHLKGSPLNSIEEQQNKEARIMWIDIMRGLLMFLVIFGHISDDREPLIYIYSFHMPAYFFLTGITMAFKKDQSIGSFVADKFFGLMVPYYLLNLYVSPMREWLEQIGEANSQSFTDLLIGVLYSNADSGYKMASNTLWFIPCLFLSSVLFFAIKKMCAGDAKMMTAYTAMFIAACSIAGLNEGGGGPLHYKGALFSVVFILAGYLFSVKRSLISGAVKRHKLASAAIVPVLLTAGWKISTYNGFVSIIRNEYKTLPLFYTSALATTLAIAILLILISQYKLIMVLLKPADFIGKHTLPYIAFQTPIMKLMWFYMGSTFGTKVMPWVLIQAVLLYFAMMPFADIVDKAIPKLKPQALSMQWMTLGTGRKKYIIRSQKQA